jgi:hypothetical protein
VNWQNVYSSPIPIYQFLKPEKPGQYAFQPWMLSVENWIVSREIYWNISRMKKITGNKKEKSMNSNKKTAGIILDVRIILAALWVARMLSSLQGDTTRLHDPDALQSLIAKTGDVVVSRELLLVMSIIFVVPIIMSVLTLTLKYPVIRWVNRIIGIFFAAFDLVFLVSALFVWRSAGYELVWSIAYLMFTILIVWYAWRWPKPDGSPDNKIS